MWLITSFGFFSVVEKREDQGRDTLTIRARSKKDLANLKKYYLPTMEDVRTNEGTDYRYRASAPRDDIAKAFMQAIQELHYSNFKDEVKKKQGPPRANVYGWVWDSLYTIQTEEDLRG
jgi:hypothetical protein